MIPAALAPVAAHLWQSTIFAAVAAALTLALRGNRARVRYWVWLAASYKFLLPFSLLVSVGGLFAWRTAPVIAPSPVFTVMTETISAPVFVTPLPVVTAAPDHTAMILWVIGAVWACGFLLIAGTWLREWWRIRAIARAGKPIAHGIFDRAIGRQQKEREILRPSTAFGTQKARSAQNDNEKWSDGLARNYSATRQNIRVVTTEARLEPGVFGIFRPVLLLPESIADRLTPEQLQGIVAHELAHVRRRDNLTAAIQMLVEAIFWFYPLVWWLGGRMVDERERACDEEVLQAGSEAQAYAESVLKVCEFYLESPLRCVSGITGSDLKKRMQRIMMRNMGEGLSAWKKALLIAVGLVALTVPIVAGVITVAPRLRAQSPIETGDLPRFEVVSIKVNKSGNPGMAFPVQKPGGHVTATNSTLRMLITVAYDLPILSDQTRETLVGTPNWIDSEHFDIEAETPGNPSEAEKRRMIQSLLADRFKLKMHRETRQLPVYVLAVAKEGKTGPQLQPHTDSTKCFDTSGPMPPLPPAGTALPMPCGSFATVFGSSYRTAGGKVTMEMLAKQLSYARGIDRAVVDRTGLSGNFDLRLEWTPQLGNAESDTAAPPPIFTAIQEQLGLKLEATTGPVDVLVIDHVEAPSDNSASSAGADSQAEQLEGDLVAPRQSQGPPANNSKFDAASIKPSDGKDPRGQFQFLPGGRFVASNIPLRPLIMLAYGLPVSGYRGGLILGAPEWADSQLYNIEAKADGNPPREQMLLMLQSLLADRFKMASHWETREMPVYALVVAKPGKLGAQLTLHAADNSTCRQAQTGSPPVVAPGATPPRFLPPCGGGFRTSNSHISAEVTMETLAKFLSYYQQIDRPVVDKSGLHGIFDLNIDYVPYVRSATIFEAVQDQLGLKLVATTGPVNALMIDHVEEPSDDGAAIDGEQTSPRAENAVQERTRTDPSKFDVASVKRNMATNGLNFNILDASPAYTPTGGLFSASDVPLLTYLSFAYKIAMKQELVGVPDWVTTERFDIEARGAGNPSKDQMRLMVQSLLADRFKLRIHRETCQLPVFSLLLAKPGQTGPKLISRPDISTCDPSEMVPPGPPLSGTPPKMPCGSLLGGPGHVRGSRVTMADLATELGFTPVTDLDRIVVDRTGLAGRFDVALEFTPSQPTTEGPGTSAIDSSKPPLFTALEEQLGLKLESAMAPIEVLAIDRIEEPTPN